VSTLTFVAQKDKTECGPAALTTTLRYYGRARTLDEVKAAMHSTADGTSALDLANVAEAQGLGVAGVAVDAATALPVLRPGDILHFDSNHFVVFEALAGDGVRLVDPAVGHVLVDRDTFASRFSSVALLFDRSPEALEARKRSIGMLPPP
jgi:ATP-binding cassette subfamily B protein